MTPGQTIAAARAAESRCLPGGCPPSHLRQRPRLRLKRRRGLPRGFVSAHEAIDNVGPVAMVCDPAVVHAPAENRHRI